MSEWRHVRAELVPRYHGWYLWRLTIGAAPGPERFSAANGQHNRERPGARYLYFIG